MRYLAPKLADMLAAEYVLGTLKGRARQRYENLLHAHPVLRRRVRDWELRLNRLADSAPPISPPDTTWQDLQRRLFAESEPPRWYERLNWWRGYAVLSSLVAGILAVLLVSTPTSPEPGYLATINNTGQNPVWLVSAPSDIAQLYVKNMKPMDMPEGRSCMLWLRPEGSQNYYRLGILPDRGETFMLPVGKPMRPMMPGKLLVTVEDMTGVPPEQPIGPPVYEGDWVRLASSL